MERTFFKTVNVLGVKLILLSDCYLLCDEVMASAEVVVHIDEEDDFCSVEFSTRGVSVSLTQFDRDTFAEEFLAGTHVDNTSGSTTIYCQPDGGRMIICDPQGDRSGGSRTTFLIPEECVGSIYNDLKEMLAR